VLLALLQEQTAAARDVNHAKEQRYGPSKVQNVQTDGPRQKIETKRIVEQTARIPSKT
jgi:hypothetical protein